MLDEVTVSDLLHDATGELNVPDGLVDRVHQRGAHRLQRRRIVSAVAVAAAIGALTPAAIALAPTGSTRQSVGIDGENQSSGHGASTSCNAATHLAAPSAYPQLLMLPTDQRVMSAYMETRAPGCLPSHVALTLLRQSGKLVTAGVVLEGPDAPTAVEQGYGEPGQYAETILHPRVDGETATAYYDKGHATVFWAGPGGARWFLRARGINADALKSLLARLRLDARSGTATLPDASAAGWQVAPPAPDPAVDLSGWFISQWRPAGCPASRTASCETSLTVRPGPDRQDQNAAVLPDARMISLGGRPGVLAFHGSYLVWQPTPGVTAILAVGAGQASQILELAASIQPIAPTDPRLHRP
jgi:hypothetical protein